VSGRFLADAGFNAAEVADFVRCMDDGSEMEGEGEGEGEHATSAQHNAMEEAAHTTPHEAAHPDMYARIGDRRTGVLLWMVAAKNSSRRRLL
jgi:hypothetical protein